MLAQGVDIVDDGLFVAHYGELAYRASTVAYPVQVAVMAVAVGTSIGVNSVLSRALGRHDVCAALYARSAWGRAI
jgi:Na+-driven multidrug efflux pump